MSLSKLIPSLLVATFAVGIATAPSRAQAQAQAQINLGSGIVITDLDLEGLNFNAATGLLTATGGTVTGTLAGLPFTTDVENFQIQLMPGMEDEGCSVLDLELGPINLALLGLHVDTSPICLTVTAFPGEGLLGDLLCGLAGGDLDLLGGLPNLLSQVLTGALQQGGPSQQQQQGGAEDICSGEVEVLDLALGPVDLTLLGLNVHLDDCENGPVQICVSATASEGILGGLLAGLAGGGLLDNLGLIEDLLDTVLDALNGQTLNARQTRQLVNRLVGQLTGRLQDGALSAADAAKITKTIRQALR